MLDQNCFSKQISDKNAIRAPLPWPVGSDQKFQIAPLAASSARASRMKYCADHDAAADSKFKLCSLFSQTEFGENLRLLLLIPLFSV